MICLPFCVWLAPLGMTVSRPIHAAANVCAQSLESRSTLCDPVDCSPSGSSVHGILQARILQWVVVPSSRGSSWTRDWPAFPTLKAESLPSWVLQLTLFCSFDGWVIFHCIYVPHSVYSCVNEHLVCFHALAIINSVAIEHWDASIFSNYGFFWVFA